MTTEVANTFYDIPTATLKSLLRVYRSEIGSKHTPSVKAVRAVAGYLGHRQRPKRQFRTDVVDDTLDQIAEKTSGSKASTSDTLRFLEWAGLLTTLRRGGGRHKLPTVRRLNTSVAYQKHLGIVGELSGIFRDLHEKPHDLIGAFPETPRVLPRYIPRVNTSTDEEFSYEEPFNEEDFVEEEFGFTPEDVLACINRFDIDCDVASSHAAWEPF